MTTQELIQKHLEEKCKNCTNVCDGIHITNDEKTRGDKDGD